MMMNRLVIAFAFLGTAAVTVSLLQKQNVTDPSVAADSLETPSDTIPGVDVLKRAIKLHADSQYAEAIATYDQAAQQLPQIKEWISIYSAASAAYLGDTAEVARRLNAAGDSLAAQYGWRARIRAFTNARARQRALQVATVETTRGTVNKRAEAWFRISELQRDLGDAAAQRDALLQILQIAPESGIARDAALVLSNKDLSPSQRVRVGRSLLANRDVARGVTQIERAFEADALPLAERAQLRFEMGRALFNAGNYEDASKQLQRVTRTHARAAEARYLLGRAQYRSGNQAEARRTFRSVASDYPRTQSATRALYQLGDLAHDDGNIAEAAAFFERAAATGAKVDQTAQALMRRGAIAFVHEQYKLASEVFEKFRARYPDGTQNAQATYWAAQALLRSGDTTRANELLRQVRRSAPLSYYGLLAANKVGGNPLGNALSPGPQTDSAARGAIATAMTRWQLLRDVEWNDPASYELGRLKERYKTNVSAQYAIAEELNDRGTPQLGIAAGRELQLAGAGTNRRLMKILYPLPYRELIEREARQYGLDPYFIAGLMRQESRFNARAVSGAGAVGLMQVMPATGRQLASGLNVGPVTPATLTDPEVNIKLGTKFLSDLVNTYGKRLDAVLIAYNAGPTRIQRWRSLPEYPMEDLFAERIPFDETRDYVKIVQANAAIYRALYAPETTSD